MRGHPPEIFDGQRKNTHKFVREFNLWRMYNIKNDAMNHPYQRVALALSYIKGPKVDDWVATRRMKCTTRSTEIGTQTHHDRQHITMMKPRGMTSAMTLSRRSRIRLRQSKPTPILQGWR